MKWCLLVNDQEHTDAIKTAPYRQNGLAIRGIRAEARGHLEDLLRCRHAGAATVENELVKILQHHGQYHQQ